MVKGRTGAAAAVILLAASTAWTVESISMLLPGEQVTSSLAFAGDRRVVAFAGVEGAKLTLTAAASRASQAVPELSLVAPDGTEYDLGATNPGGGKRASAKKIELGSTGLYRIGVQSAAGGEFTLKTKCKVPHKRTWTGALADATAVHEQFVPAAPGGLIAVSVVAKGKPAFDPTVELLAPSGASLRTVAGAKGRASIPVVRLEELGRYVVRVTGGPGEFTAAAVVTPAKKRTLTYHDVESRPDIASASPAAMTNDTVVTFVLGGVGFAADQTAAVVAGSATKAAAPLREVDATGAKAQIDLSGVAPGTYGLRVVTRDGNDSDAPVTLTVTNRPPAIGTVSPIEISNKYPILLDVRGGGFDATASISLTRASDALPLPLTVQSRTSHTGILARVVPPAYTTGPCDVEVKDPGGEASTRTACVDLLGFRSAPAALRQYNGSDAWASFYPRDSVWDTTRDRVLLAAQEKNNVVLILFDPATLTVADTLVLSAQSLGVSGSVVRPRLAYDAVTDSFAIGLTVGQSNQAYPFLRVVSAANIQATLLQTAFAWAVPGVSQVTPAANQDDGGFVVAWHEYSSQTGAKIKTQVVTPALTTDAAQQHVIASHPAGYVWEPVIAYQGNRRFVIAWIGAVSDVDYAMYATVADADGVQTFDAGPYVTATSSNWNDLFQPEITRNHTDGSMLLAFTYLDVNVYRPGVQRLAPVSANPGPYASLDASSQLPQGYIDSVRWNPARNEFVATMTNVENRVAVRRVNPEGTIRPTTSLESYEGIWGVLYAGPDPGELGLSRAFDGTDDDLHFSGTQVMQALAGPLR
jgi:hypothetical protein